jgi:NAD(P)-dependent dehydrogenase (short-subunit alcohol dehydrogenase family)
MTEFLIGGNSQRMGQGLQDRVAVVTGAGSGIGRATALALAAAGARVAVADLLLPAAVASVAEIREHGGVAEAVQADVADPASVRSMLEAVHATLGSVGILVNNAGICPTTPLLDVTLEEWNRVLAVNLTGAFLCAQAVLPDMIANRWGRIVSVSSLAGQVGGIIVGPHYAASKGGLLALTKSLARLGAPHNITANAIAPGTVDTPLRDRFAPADQERLLGAALVQRTARPEEIAAGVLYLVSDEAAYVTGHTLAINGGAFMQ